METDMDQIGAMAQNKLFYEKVFLQRYSTSIMIEWIKCEDHIKRQRDRRQDLECRKNFEDLKNTVTDLGRKNMKESCCREDRKD